MKNRSKYILVIILISVLLFIILYIRSTDNQNPGEQNEPPGTTYEESIRRLPPPPENLNGFLKDGKIELRWDAPEKVRLPHNYSDVITHYNIYRGISEENMSYYASTSDVFYNDLNVTRNSQYVYEVTAVHEGDSESAPSIEVTVIT